MFLKVFRSIPGADNIKYYTVDVFRKQNTQTEKHYGNLYINNRLARFFESTAYKTSHNNNLCFLTTEYKT
jgi:hypothetical protein